MSKKDINFVQIIKYIICKQINIVHNLSSQNLVCYYINWQN